MLPFDISDAESNRAFAILHNVETARDARLRLRSEVVTDSFVKRQPDRQNADHYIGLLMRAYIDTYKEVKAMKAGMQTGTAPSNSTQWV